MRKAFGTSAAVAILVIGGAMPPVGRAQQASVPQQPDTSAIQLAFQTADRIPRRAMSETEWRAAKRQAAIEGLTTVPPTVAGMDLYYLGMLESLAERWKPAAAHLRQYLALPGTPSPANLFNARTALRQAFISGEMTAEAEQYYASDPIELALFFSQQGDNERTLRIYEGYLASNPPADRAKLSKQLIVITVGTLRRPDEMARRLEAYRADLTPNNIVNDYSTISRLYLEAGEAAKAETYLRLLFEYCKETRGDSKAVDGPVNAHINWVIARLDGENDPSRVNDFIHRVGGERRQG